MHERIFLLKKVLRSQSVKRENYGIMVIVVSVVSVGVYMMYALLCVYGHELKNIWVGELILLVTMKEAACRQPGVCYSSTRVRRVIVVVVVLFCQRAMALLLFSILQCLQHLRRRRVS